MFKGLLYQRYKLIGIFVHGCARIVRELFLFDSCRCLLPWEKGSVWGVRASGFRVRGASRRGVLIYVGGCQNYGPFFYTLTPNLNPLISLPSMCTPSNPKLLNPNFSDSANKHFVISVLPTLYPPKGPRTQIIGLQGSNTIHIVVFGP